MQSADKKIITPFKDVIAISFGITIIAMFIPHNFYLLLGNAAFLLICLEFASVRNAVSRGWRAITHVLGIINSTILLSIIFFLIFFPIAMLRRLFAKREKGGVNSTFVTVETEYSAQNLENMW